MNEPTPLPDDPQGAGGKDPAAPTLQLIALGDSKGARLSYGFGEIGFFIFVAAMVWVDLDEFGSAMLLQRGDRDIVGAVMGWMLLALMLFICGGMAYVYRKANEGRAAFAPAELTITPWPARPGQEVCLAYRLGLQQPDVLKDLDIRLVYQEINTGHYGSSHELLNLPLSRRSEGIVNDVLEVVVTCEASDELVSLNRPPANLVAGVAHDLWDVYQYAWRFKVVATFERTGQETSIFEFGRSSVEPPAAVLANRNH